MPEIQRIARRKLRVLNNARARDDLRIPLATCLEALHGDRAGQCSIRITRLSSVTALNLAINRELARA